MALQQTFSRRKRAAAGGQPDVYRYDEIPAKVRIQIIHIFSKALEIDFRERGQRTAVYAELSRFMREEKGVHYLSKHFRERPEEEVNSWLEHEEVLDDLIDGIEALCRLVDYGVRNKKDYFRGVKCTPDEAIAEINARLAEAAIGYRYDDGQIIRIDSEFAHAEIVVPALSLLADERFAAADEEYREAHRAYREGDNETCLVNCAKAFESVLKVIGGERGWAIKATDPASKLIAAAFDAGFVPASYQTQINSIRTLLESSVPTTRNKMAGHGAGAVPRDVPDHIAALQLHQTASLILFLSAQDRDTQPA